MFARFVGKKVRSKVKYTGKCRLRSLIRPGVVNKSGSSSNRSFSYVWRAAAPVTAAAVLNSGDDDDANDGSTAAKDDEADSTAIDDNDEKSESKKSSDDGLPSAVEMGAYENLEGWLPHMDVRTYDGFRLDGYNMILLSHPIKMLMLQHNAAMGSQMYPSKANYDITARLIHGAKTQFSAEGNYNVMLGDVRGRGSVRHSNGRSASVSFESGELYGDRYGVEIDVPMGSAYFKVASELFPYVVLQSSYIQAMTPQIAVGGSVVVLPQMQKSQATLGARYTNKSEIATIKYAEAEPGKHGTLELRYGKTVNKSDPKVQLATKLDLKPEVGESELELLWGVSFKNGNAIQSSIDTSGHMKALMKVPLPILAGQGYSGFYPAVFKVSADLDHAQDECIFGIALAFDEMDNEGPVPLMDTQPPK